VKGYEKTSWIDTRTEMYEENGQQRSRVVKEKREQEKRIFA